MPTPSKPPAHDYARGDLVYAAIDLYNDEPQDDGSSALPEAAPGALLAAAGTRGMVVNVGHVEEAPEQLLYLVSFENGPESADSARSGPGGKRELGLPFTCLPEELTQVEPARSVA